MNVTSRPRLTRVRAVALVVASALIVIGLIGTRDDFTEATWTTTEHLNTTLATPLIASPVISSCVASSGTLGMNPTVTAVWHFPAGSGYVTPTNVVYLASASGTVASLVVVAVGSTVATTGPVGTDYTTVFSGSMLSGLLGGSAMIALESTVAGWTSAPATATASISLLGMIPACTIN